MDELTVLETMRRFRPGLVTMLVVGAFYFAPHYSTAVIMRVAHERAERITSLLKDAIESPLVDSRQPRSREGQIERRVRR